MKIRQALAAYFASVHGTVPRMDAVAFLRRYAVSGRDITNYRVYGRQLNSVTALLGFLDIRENRDYAVVKSDFDPKFTMIKWTPNGIIGTLAGALSANGLEPVNLLATDIALGEIRQETLDRFATREERNSDVSSGTSVTDHPIPSHFLAIDGDWGAEYANSNAPGCVGDVYDASRTSAGDNRPVSLPLDYIEEIIWKLHEEKIPTSVKPPAAILNCDCGGWHGRTAVRFLRNGEPMRGSKMLLCSPIDEVRDGAAGNPMKGYLAFTRGELGVEYRLDDKVGVYIRCDAPVKIDARVSEWCLNDPTRLWNYVKCLYEIFYGLPVAVDPLSHYAVHNHRHARTGVPVDGVGGSYGTAIANGVSNNLDLYDQTDLLMCAVYIGDSVRREPTLWSAWNPASAATCQAVQLVTAKPEGVEVEAFDLTNPTVKDIPFEWYCMTHLKSVPCSLSAHEYRNANANEHQRVEALTDFRSWCRALHASKQAAKSVFNQESDIGFADGDNFNPASAFAYGVLAVLREGVGGVSQQMPLIDGGSARQRVYADTPHHAKDVVVNALYSGVYTDKSPVAAPGTRDYSTFPKFAYATTPAETKSYQYAEAIAPAVDAIISGGLQTKMAKRTAGTPRVYTVVIETNIDANRFADACSDMLRVRCDIANTYIRNLVLRNSDPLCSVDEQSRNEGHWHFSNEDAMLGIVTRNAYGWRHDQGPIVREWSKVFGANSTYLRPSTAFCTEDDLNREGLGVGFMKDSLGRLFVVVQCASCAPYYGVMAWRTVSGLPVMSSACRARMDGPSAQCGTVLEPRLVYIPENRLRDPDAVDVFIREVWRNRSDVDRQGELLGTLDWPPYGVGPWVGYHRSNYGHGLGCLTRENYAGDTGLTGR